MQGERIWLCSNTTALRQQLLHNNAGFGGKTGIQMFSCFPTQIREYICRLTEADSIYLFFLILSGALFLRTSWKKAGWRIGCEMVLAVCYTTLGECLRIYGKVKKKSWYRRNEKGWGTEEEKLLRFRGLGSFAYQWLMWRDECVCHRLSCIVAKTNEYTWVLESNFQQESTTVKGYEGVETCMMPTFSMCLCTLLCLSDMHRLWEFLHVKSLL